MKSIIEAIATVSERDYLLDFLDQLREKSYSVDFDVKNYIKDVPQRAYPVLSELFGSALSKGRDFWMKEIDRAQEEIRNMQVVTLTTPIQPTIELAWKVKEWFRKETAREVMLEFKLDKSLIGGAVVESNGYRSEFSFRQYFEGRKKN